MILLWALVGIFSNAGVLEPDSSLLWHWFGAHPLLTILIMLLLA